MAYSLEELEGAAVECVVKEVRGKCCLGYRKGDKITFRKAKVEGKACSSFLSAAMPTIYAIKYGVKFPWDRKAGSTLFGCPSTESQVVFEIRAKRR